MVWVSGWSPREMWSAPGPGTGFVEAGTGLGVVPAAGWMVSAEEELR